jgi:arylsulfatase A-like enzyme
VWDLPQEYHYSTWTSERTIAYIQEQCAAQRPFFVWASFHDPHPPYLVPRPWATMYKPADMAPGTLDPGELDRMPPHFRKTQEQSPDFSGYQETAFHNHGFHSHLQDPSELRKDMAVYYGMISLMDQQIGRILEALDASGAAENTLVVFTTDHGHFLGQHGLRAKGAFHYEDMLRVPFIVRYPGRVPAGAVSDSLQALIDLPSTFLAAAELPIPGLMQGVNQLGVWSGTGKPARDHVLVENRHQPTAIHLRTYIDARYKVTVYRDQDYGELFDLQDDPEERRNLWNEPTAGGPKAELLAKFLNAELKREPTRYPRIAGA